MVGLPLNKPLSCPSRYVSRWKDQRLLEKTTTNTKGLINNP